MAMNEEPMEINSSETRLAEAERCRKVGSDLFRQGEYSSALDMYTKAIECDPQNYILYTNRSFTYFKLKNYSKSVDDAQTAVLKNPSHAKSHFRLGQGYLVMGKPQLAKKEILKVIELEPSNQDPKSMLVTIENVMQYLSKSEKYFEVCDYRSAYFYLQQAHAQCPGALQFEIRIAELLMLDNKYDEASRIVNAVLQENRMNSEAVYVRGMCLLRQGNPEKAVEYFKQVLTLDPDNQRARQSLRRSKQVVVKKEQGNTLLKSGQYEEAYAVYTEALTVDPDNVDLNSKLYCNRALAGSKIGKMQEAIEDCTRALELDPNYARALQRRAKLYQDNNQHEEAVRDFEKLHKQDPSRDTKQQLVEAKRLLKISKRKDFYKILGIEKNSDSNEIKKAYRKKALQHHPDRNPTASPEEKAEMEHKFKEVGEAYSVLSDPQKKHRYDNGADMEDLIDGGGFDPSELFSSLFTGGGYGGPPGFSFSSSGGFDGFRSQSSPGGFSFQFPF